MKAGRPKKRATDVSGRGRPVSQRADLDDTLHDAATAQTEDKPAPVKRKKNGLPQRTRAHNQPRQTPRRSMMAALGRALVAPLRKDEKDPETGQPLPDPETGKPLRRDLLTDGDRLLVRQAHLDGLTVNDVAALVMYKVCLAQRLFERGELAAKDMVVAIDKSCAQAAAAAQLAIGVAGKDVPRDIRISLSEAGAVKAVIPADVPLQRQEPGPVGDVLDVEGG